jgi:trigger factor
VKSTVETLGPTRVRLAIEVPFDELAPNLRKAYQQIGSQVTVPGFRKGKVPTAVIDQRVGRGAVLNEAVQEAIPEQLLAAVREQELKLMGRPDVAITAFADGEPLLFTAELDVRPDVTVPDLATIAVTIDSFGVDDEAVDAEVDRLRARFATLRTVERATQRGDFVQIDLSAAVDGEALPAVSQSNLSHEVGSNTLLPGLDEAIDGLSAGEEATFTAPLVAGEHAGKAADVTVTVRSVRERDVPDATDDFASMASEFDTLDELRDDLRARLGRARATDAFFQVRDQTIKAVVAASGVPAPEGVVRDTIAERKESIAAQLEQMGATLPAFLASEGKDEETFDAEVAEAAREMVVIQLVLDAYADAEKLSVTDDEFGQEIITRAQQARVSPQQYYDRLQRAGEAPTVYHEVRRGKALSAIMSQIAITDSDSQPVTLEQLRWAATDHTGHDHGDDGAEHDHEHHDHDHDHHHHDHDHADHDHADHDHADHDEEVENEVDSNVD